jgi:hypothetical protein
MAASKSAIMSPLGEVKDEGARSKTRQARAKGKRGEQFVYCRIAAKCALALDLAAMR